MGKARFEVFQIWCEYRYKSGGSCSADGTCHAYVGDKRIGSFCGTHADMVARDGRDGIRTLGDQVDKE